LDDPDLEAPRERVRGKGASSAGALIGCVLFILVVAFGDWRQLALASALCAVTVAIILVFHRVTYALEAKRVREMQILRRLEIEIEAETRRPI
jgi:Flp pilus assembly protein TadB